MNIKKATNEDLIKELLSRGSIKEYYIKLENLLRNNGIIGNKKEVILRKIFRIER